jgi:hypothetical protein
MESHTQIVLKDRDDIHYVTISRYWNSSDIQMNLLYIILNGARSCGDNVTHCGTWQWTCTVKHTNFHCDKLIYLLNTAHLLCNCHTRRSLLPHNCTSTPTVCLHVLATTHSHLQGAITFEDTHSMCAVYVFKCRGSLKRAVGCSQNMLE